MHHTLREWIFVIFCYVRTVPFHLFPRNGQFFSTIASTSNSIVVCSGAVVPPDSHIDVRVPIQRGQYNMHIFIVVSDREVVVFELSMHNFIIERNGFLQDLH